MRKLLLALAMLGGVAVASAVPASANVAAGLAPKPAATATVDVVEKVSRRRHRGGIYFGFGRPYYGSGYGYGYGRPYYRRHYGYYGGYRPYRRHYGYRRHWY